MILIGTGYPPNIIMAGILMTLSHLNSNKHSTNIIIHLPNLNIMILTLNLNNFRKIIKISIHNIDF